MSEKRRGLGRGLGALIPSGPMAKTSGDRPVDDVFFRDKSESGQQPVEAGAATATATLERPAGDLPSLVTADLEPVVPAGDGETEPDSDTDLVPVPGATFAELPVTSIRPNPKGEET